MAVAQCSYNRINLQFLVQVALITDGVNSFAIFLYEDPADILGVPAVRVGFSAGQGMKMTDVLDSLETMNIFRIDGMECLQEGNHMQSFL